MSKKSRATIAVDLAHESGAELWSDPDGDPYVDIYTDSGARRTIRVRSRACRTYLSGLIYDRQGDALGGQAATDAVDVLTAMALHEGPTREVHVRIAAGPDGATYLDLGDESWQAVKIMAGRWEIVDRPPVRFRRPRGLRTLRRPVRGTDGVGFRNLRRILHMGSDQDWILVVAWLLGTLHPSGPYPILALHGEHGTAKSTTGRILRSMIDPSEAPLRSPPRDDRDVVVAARNGHIVGLDNLSYIKTWLSDALCRIATGGGYSARELYTDGEEVIYSDTRPILLTSIEGVATRGDLSDRTIAVTLPRLPEEARRTEADLWADVAMWQGEILGDLLDAAATGVGRVDSVHLDSLPRMADFAAWVVACEPALPWEDGDFMEAYAAQRAESVETGIEADPVATAIRELHADLEDGEWKGTATDLLAELDRRRGGKPIPHGWPETPQSLGGKLTRAAPLLREVGIEVCKYRDSDSSGSRISHVHSKEKSCQGCQTRQNGTAAEGPSDGRQTEDARSDAGSDTSDGSDRDIRSRTASEGEPWIQELEHELEGAE